MCEERRKRAEHKGPNTKRQQYFAVLLTFFHETERKETNTGKSGIANRGKRVKSTETEKKG